MTHEIFFKRDKVSGRGLVAFVSTPAFVFDYGSSFMRKLFDTAPRASGVKYLMGAVLFLTSSAVLAQAAGVGSVVTNGINFVNLIGKLLVAVFALGGLGAVGRGAFLFIKKGGDRGDDIEWSKIGYLIIGGVLAMVISWFAFGVVATLGGGADDVGKTITLGRG